jgi:hypothetical protein
MLFFFTGATAIVMDTPYHFTRFGQTAEMDEAFAQECCLKGLQIIPASDPAAKAFTAAELQQYPARHQWHAPDAPSAFADKVAAVDAALETYRQSLIEMAEEESTDANAK